MKAFDKYEAKMKELDNEKSKKFLKKNKKDLGDVNSCTKKIIKSKKNVPETPQIIGEHNVTRKKKMEPINSTGMELKASRTLKDKIKQGELVVSQTDKSSRFAVLTKKQYLDSGRVHTAKDKKNRVEGCPVFTVAD